MPCPLSRREIRARALLPRLGVRICCVDDGRGLAEQLAAWLEGIGCTDVAVLDGGTKAWAAAGYELFSGVNVPSKAFGEWVEHHYGTESVDAPELKSWIDSGRNIVVLDSRTHEEFVRMSIPTGISVPGGELVYRIGDIVPDPKTLVVVNCAGRTRSIMGAESLRRAGIPNKVVALRNGTMGWELAGFRCDRGRTRALRTRHAEDRGDRAAARPGLRGKLGRGRDRRHRSGPRSKATRTARCMCWTCAIPPSTAPATGRQHQRAGRAAGAGDRPVGRRAQRAHRAGGRYRRACPHGRRVAAPDGSSRRVRRGRWAGGDPYRRARAPAGAGTRCSVPTIDVTGLVALLDSGDGTVVIDLARSIDFREGHIPGALWGVRTRLAALAPQLAGAKHVVITSPDGMLARLAVAEVKG